MVKPIPQIVQAQPLSGYRVRLEYADGVAGEVDLSRLVGKGIFQLWKDPAAFARISIGSGGELRWNEEVDLCADSLYLELTRKQPEDVFPSLKKAPVDA